MRFILLFQLLVVTYLANGQFQQVNIDSFTLTTAFEDTVSLSEISVKKALFIIVNGKSCTACKITISKFVSTRIDTSELTCFILIKNIKSSLAKQLAFANFKEQFPFIKNVLFYTSNGINGDFPHTRIKIDETLNGPSPSIWLINLQEQKSVILQYSDLFLNSTSLTSKSIFTLSNF